MILSDAEVEVNIYRVNEQTAFLCQSQLLYQDTSILPHAGLTAPCLPCSQDEHYPIYLIYSSYASPHTQELLSLFFTFKASLNQICDS